MSAHLFCSNVFAWSVQMALLIGAGGVACALVRLRDPRTRLLLLQTLLALSLVLPVASALRPVPTVVSGGVSVRSTVISAAAPASIGFHAMDWIAGLLVAGVALRLGWLALGIVRLRALRRRAVRAELPPAIRALQTELRTFADFYVSEEVSSPVTFGFTRGVVLVPPTFMEACAASQRAMACHELLHLERKDWLFTLAEEFVRALFWFHPAVWWLLARIQLAREELVDRESISRTGDRAGYITALLAMAGQMVQADLAPAPLFLTRHHLAKRIASIQKGGRMSVRRIVSSLAAALPLIGVAVVIGWQSFPLTAAPQMAVEDSPGVAVAQSTYKVLRRTGIEYPHAALAAGAMGEVVAAVTVDENGNIADAKIVAGPQELRAAVLRSVLEWRFDPNQEFPPDRTFEISVRFTPPPAEDVGAEKTELSAAYAHAIRVGGNVQATNLIRKVLPVYPPAARQARIQGTVRFGALIGKDGHVRDLEVVSGHPLLVEAARTAVAQWVYRPTLLNGDPVEVSTAIDVNFTLAP